MSEPTLRDRLLSSPAKPAGEFVLAGTGQTVYLRRWSLRDRMRVFAVSEDKTRPALDRVGDYLRLILCDADNRRLFADDDDAACDLPLGADEANALIAAALAANGMGGGGGEKKASSSSSGETPNSDSSGGSP